MGSARAGLVSGFEEAVRAAPPSSATHAPLEIDVDEFAASLLPLLAKSVASGRIVEESVDLIAQLAGVLVHATADLEDDVGFGLEELLLPVTAQPIGLPLAGILAAFAGYYHWQAPRIS